jgi:hypothetical protein
MGLTTREVGSSSFNDMISSIDRRSEFVENRAGANVTTNNALISYGLSNSCSILNAPCGYSNGVYPSLTPIKTFGIDADFDFTRGSSATRVNELGLVQDVQLLSGELVQNGDFEEIGSELVTNGGFDTDTGWTKGTGWSIANGSLNGVNATSSTYQNNGLVSGKFYKVVYDVSNYSSGTVQLKLGGTLGEARNENGTYTEYIKASQVITWIVGTNFTGSIDNVSVKEVGQNWTFFGEAEFTENGARIYSSSGSNSYIGQTILTNTKKYKLSYEIVDSTQGGLKLINVNGVSDYSIPSTLGTHSIDFIANNPSFFILRDSGITDVTIDNISVIEITDDTDLPRINYTNFDYENGEVVPYSGEGSLLLEPQRSNGLNYSEPTSSEYLASGITYESFDWSLGFTNCIKFGDNSQTRYRYFNGTIANSTEYTISAFVIMDDLSEPVLGTASNNGDFIFRVGGTTATTGNLPNVNMGNNIYRVSSVITSDVEGGTTGLLKYSGQSNKGFRIVGFQVEQGSYATSYIPTNGSTVTRLADVCNNSGNSDLINSTEGVLYAEISALANDGTNRYISLSDGSVSNRVNIFFDSNNNLRGFYNGLSGSITINTDITLNNKIAFKYKSGDSSFWFNGFEVATRTDSLSLSGLDSVSFDLGGGSDFYGNVKCVAVFKEALSDTELQKLTTI